MDWERRVQFTDGRFVKVLPPGRHRYNGRRSSLLTVDMRQRSTLVPGQELLTGDGITVKVSVLVVWHVTDPHAFLTASAGAEYDLYNAAQLAVRDAVAATAFDDVLADRGRLSAGLAEATAARLDGLGIELASATVKDLMLPGELRRAATETLLARERGKAELEHARAEAASLRALANAAKLLQDHPALLQLRTIQAAATPGTTIVLTPDPSYVPR
ncbi:slipin family protein [Phytohabitans sp. LJ34]|uniref:slipin family protein n=1 Tax=Phytohabitans sp. LJ34 TaxID=3452217 RepID=UPI003F8952A4